MGFTAKVAIHASRPYIWRRLMGFGLNPDPVTPMKTRNASNRLCTIVEDGVFYNVNEKALEGMADYIYDCKDNTKLFFALAPLRDDSDIHQWFIYDNRGTADEDDGRRFWFVCRRDNIEDDMCKDRMFEDCEKAEIKEIIAHFTGWDDDEEIINQM